MSKWEGFDDVRRCQECQQIVIIHRWGMCKRCDEEAEGEHRAEEAAERRLEDA